MTQEEKAVKYDEIVLAGDRLQRELSKVKSANAGLNTTSKEYDTKVAELTQKLSRLEVEMQKLFSDY